MLCSSCRRENRDQRRFCGGCGSALGWVCCGCSFFNYAEEHFCGGCGLAERAERGATARPAANDAPPVVEVAPVVRPKAGPTAATRAALIRRELSTAAVEQPGTESDRKKNVSQDEINRLFGK